MIRDVVGTIGAWLIYALIQIFGRPRDFEHDAWLAGPLGQNQRETSLAALSLS